METTTGPLGLTIPIQTLASSKEVVLKPAEVKKWRNSLPMADLGESTKHVYHAISDCNKVNLSSDERFEILELIRAPVQFSCQSLRKHYTGQTTALNKQQMTIANLSQTLQIEMAYGYKIIIEQLANTPKAESAVKILPIALQRVVSYFTQIILRSYMLHYGIPKDIWRELHLLYNFAEQHKLQESISEEYKRILLMAGSYPYQWRQNEQNAIYRATEAWGGMIDLKNDKPDPVKPGFLIIDVSADKGPKALIRGDIDFSSSCKSIDLNPIVARLQELLTAIEPDELQARISHHNEAEYALSTPVLKGLIKEWGEISSRAHERTECLEPVKICIGLRSTHFYVNNEQPFDSGGVSEVNLSSNEAEEAASPASGLGIQIEEESSSEEESSEGEDMNTETSIDFSGVSDPVSNDSPDAYPFYPCMMVNETPAGYALLFSKDVSPPAQTGEVIGLRQENGDQAILEVCAIRWLKYTSENELRLGVERLSSKANATGIQLFKNGTMVGEHLRCLNLENTLLTPTLPFKTGSNIHLSDTQYTPSEDDDPIQLYELTTLLDTTSSYKRFEYVEKKIEINEEEVKQKEEQKKHEEEQKREDDEFDSVWSDL